MRLPLVSIGLFAIMGTVLIAQGAVGLAGMAASNEVLTWQTHIQGMAVGGIAAMFAVAVWEPKSKTEVAWRVGFGIFFMYVTTGKAMEWLHISPSLYNVLTYGLISGSFGWSLWAWSVRAVASSPGRIGRAVARIFIGSMSDLLPEDASKKKDTPEDQK